MKGGLVRCLLVVGSFVRPSVRVFGVRFCLFARLFDWLAVSFMCLFDCDDYVMFMLCLCHVYVMFMLCLGVPPGDTGRNLAGGQADLRLPRGDR